MEPEEGISSLGAGAPGGCELQDVDAKLLSSARAGHAPKHQAIFPA